MKSTLRVSKSADGLAQRIVVLLGSGARPVKWFRSFAATDAMFEQAIGRLFIKGQVRFIGSGKGRRLARAKR
jgi:hypothetical protein